MNKMLPRARWFFAMATIAFERAAAGAPADAATWKWTVAAAQLNHAQATALAAFLLETSADADEPHFKLAENAYRRATMQGDCAFAEARLAFLKYHWRPGVRISWDEAAQWQSLVGQHALERLSWIARLAQRQHPLAQFAMAGFAMTGALGESCDDAAVFRWCDSAYRAQPRVSGAANLLGTLYLNGIGIRPNAGAAYRLYLEAASCKDPAAMYNLGALHERGAGPDLPADAGAAFMWYQRASERGAPNAENVMGILHEGGDLGVPSLSAALQSYAAAARKGHPHALYNLGRLFHEGVGAGRCDHAFARDCFRRAAVQGHTLSQQSLAVLVELELGVGGPTTDHVAATSSEPQQRLMRARSIAPVFSGTEHVAKEASAASDGPGSSLSDVGLLGSEAGEWYALAAKAGASESRRRLAVDAVFALVPPAVAVLFPPASSRLAQLPAELRLAILDSCDTFNALDASRRRIILNELERLGPQATSREQFDAVWRLLGPGSLPADPCECVQRGDACASVRHQLLRWA